MEIKSVTLLGIDVENCSVQVEAHFVRDNGSSFSLPFSYVFTEYAFDSFEALKAQINASIQQELRARMKQEEAMKWVHQTWQVPTEA